MFGNMTFYIIYNNSSKLAVPKLWLVPFGVSSRSDRGTENKIGNGRKHQLKKQ